MKITSIVCKVENGQVEIMGQGESGDFFSIAPMPVERVYEALADLRDQIDEEESGAVFDDSMDGDHQSALASCGWGGDEDYGYFGDGEY